MSTPTPSVASDVPVDRRVALAAAQDAVRNGDAAEAIRQYRAILAAHPSDADGRRGLAEVLASTGELRASITELDALLGQHPDDLAAWRARAAAARSLADPAELLCSVEGILRLDPADRTVRFEEYHLRDLTGDAPGAYRALSELTNGNVATCDGPSLAELLLCQGDLAIRLGRSEEAEAAYERASQIDDAAKASVAVRRARLALADGRPDLALERLQPALANESGTDGPSEAVLLRGELLLMAERPADAQLVFDALFARDPTSGPALVGAARARIEQGHHPEARALLQQGRERVGRDERLILALAEAESGSGDLTAAEREVREGTETFPQSRPMWTRLAELAIAGGDWATARDAYGRAETIDPQSVDAALGTAFVAEKVDDPASARAAYDRAAQLGPGDLRVWNRRGAFFLTIHRPVDALESFEHALTLAPDSDTARDGKRLAERERRSSLVDEHALRALRTEHELGRPITKNDLFVTLHVPFDLLDPVLTAIAREVKIDVATLPPSELDRLEGRSRDLITRALGGKSRIRESGEISLPDIAALAPANASLGDVQSLFAYVDAVLKLDVRPENLHLTVEMEETARRALSLPAEQRTLFGLVRTLQIGLYRARIVKAVERASGATRTPLPSVDLAPHAPELSAKPADGDGARFFDPENVPRAPGLEPLTGAHGSSSGPRRVPRGWPAGVPLLGTQREAVRSQSTNRCVGCGGLATLRHPCGGPLCRLCASQFGNCPKCGAAIGPLSTGARAPRARTEPPKVTPARASPAPSKSPAAPTVVRHPTAPARESRPTPVAAPVPKAEAPKPPKGSRATTAPQASADAPKPVNAAPSPPPARPKREKVDDEPRL